MIFPDVSLNEWLEKYPELGCINEEELELCVCSECNEKVLPKQPYIEKNYVGLISLKCPHCGCKNKTDFSITNTEGEYLKWRCV